MPEELTYLFQGYWEDRMRLYVTQYWAHSEDSVNDGSDHDASRGN